MKITTISKVVLSMTIVLASLSFTYARETDKEEKETKSAAFGASVYNLVNTNKIKLSIDRTANADVNIVIRDTKGRRIYHEVLDKNSTTLYRRILDLQEVEDGVYYIVLTGKDTKISKRVEVSSMFKKMIIL